MAMYSHSRVSTYENCPYQYKLRYIDKIRVEIPTTIEAFMGNSIFTGRFEGDLISE